MKLLMMSHGPMAEGTLASAELIMGPIASATAIGLTPEMGPEDLQAAAEKVIATAKDDETMIVAVDLLGGTPSNVVVRLLAEHPKLEVVTGLNLPMVIDYANQVLIGQKFDKHALLQAAQDGVMDLNYKLAASDDEDDEE